MDMAAILFNGAEQIKKMTILSTEGTMCNLLKIGRVVSEKTFKGYAILYINIAQGQGQITWGQIFYHERAVASLSRLEWRLLNIYK